MGRFSCNWEDGPLLVICVPAISVACLAVEKQGRDTSESHNPSFPSKFFPLSVVFHYFHLDSWRTCDRFKVKTRQHCQKAKIFSPKSPIQNSPWSAQSPLGKPESCPGGMRGQQWPEKGVGPTQSCGREVPSRLSSVTVHWQGQNSV